MTWRTQFHLSVTEAAKFTPGPRKMPWPMPGNLGGFREFEKYLDWQQFVISFELRDGVPLNIRKGFERAQKLYLLAWIDFDLVPAADMTALSALEFAFRDCYFSHIRDRRLDRANNSKIPASKRKKRSSEETILLSELLKYALEHDGLSDNKIPIVARCGGSVIGLLNGDRRPSLADMRNSRAHGNPFENAAVPGLLEIVRDLIEYAYRGWIMSTRSPPAPTPDA